ncbi:MAG: hypothetical protein PW843_09325 [Azospirillaceae bacterium]|nr:hypothetical protein [Azospirillaceae bacterium]
MKSSVRALALIMTVAFSPLAQAESGVSRPDATASAAAPLPALLAEWNQAGFAAPAKPGQPLVHGRNGAVTTGADYATLVSLIRTATQATREGRGQDAAAAIAKAHVLLAASRA